MWIRSANERGEVEDIDTSDVSDAGLFKSEHVVACAGGEAEDVRRVGEEIAAAEIGEDERECGGAANECGGGAETVEAAVGGKVRAAGDGGSGVAGGARERRRGTRRGDGGGGGDGAEEGDMGEDVEEREGGDEEDEQGHAVEKTLYVLLHCCWKCKSLHV